MNFLVYEMDSIKNLRGEEREWINGVIERLRNQPVQPGSPRVPFFEAIGRGYFKKRSGLKRLIAFREDIRTSYGIAPVVIFLELISRTDPHYEDGKAERLSRRYDLLINNHHKIISQWIEEQLRQQKQIFTHPLPEMPESLNTLLQRIPIDERGAGIFHSEFWNNQFRQASSLIKGQLYQALNKIISKSHEMWQRYELTSNNVSIHYVTIPDPHDITCHYYLLGFTTSSWSHIEIDNSKYQIEENWHQFEEEVILPLQIEFEKSQTSSSKSKQFIDHVSRFSSCAYPTYLLADEELWEKLISTDSTLLPLSSEELDALEQLSSGERFPGIIEGRAGSGKTTLLCCYVPERLVRLHHPVTKAENGHRLLYLAENRRLLERAEEVINKLKKN